MAEFQLPIFQNLPVQILGQCFKNVSNSYKFYWFLAILDHVSESDESYISLDEMSLRMLSAAWYPLDYYKLSFGKQDGFKDLALTISDYIEVDNSLKAPSLLQQLENNLPEAISLKLKHKIKVGLKRWVTYRFLSPFFESHLKGIRDQQANDIISKLSNAKEFTHHSPYQIQKAGILLNESWITYFKMNQNVLRGFIKWYLVRFLQKNNPNVIGLEKPIQRDLKVAKQFWVDYLTNKEVKCIYSEKVLSPNVISLDHFIPWSYIAHNQLWNIVPTIANVNSAKGNMLPSLSHYLEKLCDIQHQAYHHHLLRNNYKLLDDFATLFKLDHFREIPIDLFKEKLMPEIANHHRIAANLGFYSPFILKPAK
jgi:hypothetical protein